MRLCLLLIICFNVTSALVARPQFDVRKDILIAQFDSKPDPDDIHAQAALGTLLSHPDLEGVRCYAVAGAIGIQDGEFIDSTELFNLAFGPEGQGWTNAHRDWHGSVTSIHEQVAPILKAGGKVWVQEAGQSDITAAWIRSLLADGFSEAVIKARVIVVQHSQWNEDKSTPDDLIYVKEKANYQQIDDGNARIRTGPDRGPDTPQYLSENTEFLEQAKTTANEKARQLWAEADRICDALTYRPDYSRISTGGIDFSDCVENMWIFDITGVDTVDAFWQRFVMSPTESL